MTITTNRDQIDMTITEYQPANDHTPTPPSALHSPTPSPKPDGNFARSLVRTLASERIKLTTIRSNRIIVGLTVAIGLSVSWAVATFVTDEVLTVAEVFSFSIVFTAVFAAVAGILSFTAEAEHGTLGLTIAARPERTAVTVAKTISAGLFGALLGAAGLAAGLAGAALSGINVGDTSTIVPTSGWAILFTTLAAILGLGVGMISRSGAGAISGLLVWWLVIENLIVAFADRQVSRYLPFTAGNRLLDFEPEESELLGDLLSRPAGALIFGGYTLAALLIGAAMFRRSDAG
jgi:ABC-2 type transport system permease protein